jgi:hypothetical protein
MLFFTSIENRLACSKAIRRIDVTSAAKAFWGYIAVNQEYTWNRTRIHGGKLQRVSDYYIIT